MGGKKRPSQGKTSDQDSAKSQSSSSKAESTAEQTNTVIANAPDERRRVDREVSYFYQEDFDRTCIII